MTDFEKVMQGLLHHITPIPCDGCPYDDADPHCSQRLAEDALALLKEQEPRVLTLEDVCGGDECWIEYRYGGNGYADVYLEEPGRTAKVYRCHPVGYKRPETVWLHDYGKLWRGWSYRPIEDQRRETPWRENAI